MLIHLNGMPGVGKLTVARILAEKLPAHLLDNHAIINAVYAAGQIHGSPGYIRYFKKLSVAVYEGLVDNPDISNVIMTNALVYKAESDLDRFQDIVNLAAARNESFVPVMLVCDLDENIKRAMSVGRKERQKLTDPDRLRLIAGSGYRIIHPADHPNALEIDTTHLSAEQTAAKIQAHVEKLLSCHPGEGRDPDVTRPRPAPG